MSSANQYGLIILGNSGVGKSFLANILIGRDTFVHQFNATSVTHTTESVDVTIGSYTLTVFNIPGLIEAEQSRIDLNKQEIDKAFTQRPNSIIMFVFGQQNGRIRGQDVVAFNAINEAYPFRPESLVLVVNGIPKNRDSDYEETTLPLLQKLLKGVDVNSNNLCFTDSINMNNANEKQALKNRLLQFVTKLATKTHEKQQDIQTIISELKAREQEIQEQQVKLEAEREKHRKQIEEQKRIAAEQIAEQQRRVEELRVQEQARLAAITEQRCQMVKQRAAQEAEAKNIRDRIAAAGSTVPAGQTHHNNVVLSGNTFHVYGTMMGHVSGHGTVNMYEGSRIGGGINGQIKLMILGNATIG